MLRSMHWCEQTLSQYALCQDWLKLFEISPFSGLWLWREARFRFVIAFMLFSSFDRRTDDGRMKGNPKSLIRESSIRVILKV